MPDKPLLVVYAVHVDVDSVFDEDWTTIQDEVIPLLTICGVVGEFYWPALLPYDDVD